MLKSKKIFYILCSVGILFFSCKSNYQVIHLTKNVVPGEKNGFYYSLPKTFVKVDLIVNQQENIKGPYCDYAKKYFGLNNVINQNSTTYKINDIKIETYAEPDSSQYYFVETNDSKIGMVVNRLGILKAVNPVKTTEGNFHYIDIDSITTYSENDYPDLFRMYANSSLYKKTDTIYKPVRVFNSIIFEKAYKTFLIEKPTEQKVKEIADLISKMKDNRFNLLNGDLEINDKKSIEFIYAELQNLENEYMKLFTGITLNHTLTYNFIYLPEKDSNTNITKALLCKFSTEKGVMDKSNTSGDNIYIQIIDNKTTLAVNKYNNEKRKLQKGKQGFFHRLPAYTDINILYNNSLLQNSKQLIAQFGVVLALPTNNTFLLLDENTGAIRQMQIKN
ncbi:MAG: DUF4831 family protein [Bacteroidales bacterium]